MTMVRKNISFICTLALFSVIGSAKTTDNAGPTVYAIVDQQVERLDLVDPVIPTDGSYSKIFSELSLRVEWTVGHNGTVVQVINLNHEATKGTLTLSGRVITISTRDGRVFLDVLSPLYPERIWLGIYEIFLPQ